CNAGTLSVTSVVDSAGNIYAVACPTIAITNNQAFMYYAPVTVASDAGTNTVTLTLSGSGAFVEMIVAEYDGGLMVLDKTSSASGNSTALNSGNTAAITSPNELVVGYGFGAGAVSAAGAGFTGRIVATDAGATLFE